MTDIIKAKQASSQKRDSLIKMVTTVIICYAHFSYGFMNFIVGPSLIDMTKILNTEISTISLYFTVVQIGYTLGAFCGFLYNYLNRQLMTVLLLSMMGLSLAMIPHTTNVWMMFCCGALIGIGMGGWDCAMNVWVVDLWKETAGSILQAACAFYAVGSIIAPQVVNPFLTGEKDNHTASTEELADPTEAFNWLAANATTVRVFTTTMPDNEDIHEGIPNRRAKLAVPYSTAGALVVTGSMLILLIFCYARYFVKQAPTTKRVSVGSFLVDKKTQMNMPLILGWHAKLLTVLGALLVATYFALEVTYLQLFPTFIVYATKTTLKLAENDATLILSAITAAEAIGRFMSIFIMMKVKPQYILSVNFIIITIGFLIVYFGKSSLIALWVGNIVTGFGFASCCPGIYGFLKQYMAITNIKGTIFVSSAGFAQAILPAIVGRFIKNTPMILIYANFLLMAGAVAAFLAIIFLVRLNAIQNRPKMSVTSMENGKTAPRREIKEVTTLH